MNHTGGVFAGRVRKKLTNKLSRALNRAALNRVCREVAAVVCEIILFVLRAGRA